MSSQLGQVVEAEPIFMGSSDIDSDWLIVSGGTDSIGTEYGGTDSGGTDSGGTDSGGTDSGGTDLSSIDLEWVLISGDRKSSATESSDMESSATKSSDMESSATKSSVMESNVMESSDMESNVMESSESEWIMVSEVGPSEPNGAKSLGEFEDVLLMPQSQKHILNWLERNADDWRY